MKIFHRTYAASEILSNGFKDGEGRYMTRNVYRGVWFSDGPLGVNEGACGDVVLVVDSGDTDLDEFEWAEEGKGYREWLVPAVIANLWPVEISDDCDLIDDLEDQILMRRLQESGALNEPGIFTVEDLENLTEE